MPKQKKSQNRVLLLLAAIAIVLVAVAATIAIRSGAFFFGRVEVPEPHRYKRIIFYDAKRACDMEIKEELGDRLKTVAFDNFSSRLEEKDWVYKMFYEVELSASGFRGREGTYYVACFTLIDRPEVVHFDISNRATSDAKVIRQRQGRLLEFSFPK